MRKLPREEIIKLINLYREHECLWNIRSKIYKKTSLKILALEAISKSMCVPVEEIKKRLRTLRCRFVLERKKELESKKCGDVFHSSLFWYNEMKFLVHIIVPRTSTHDDEETQNGRNFTDSRNTLIEKESSIEEDNTETDLDFINISKSSLPLKKKKNNKTNDAEDDFFDKTIKELMRLTVPSIKIPNDEFDIYGKAIACKIRKINKISEFEAEDTLEKINNIVSEKIKKLLKKK